MTELFNFPGFSSEYDMEYNCGNGAYMHVYKDADKSDFNEYISKLSNVFEVLSHNTIENNDYYTFKTADLIVHIYYVDCEKTVRVISDPYTALYNVKPETYEKKCETMIYQFETDHTLIDCGMCYIIRCCDGSFFIIDSAHFYQTHDDQRIFDFLKSISLDGNIIINGWFFSHAHDDHVSKFMDFIRKYNDEVTIKALYYNFIASGSPDEKYWGDCNINVMKQFNRLVEKYSSISKIKLHSGQKFYIKDLEFQVLCTHEDVYPGSFEDFNDTSTSLLLTVGGTKVLLPGDSAALDCEVLTSRFTAKTLKSDILQVSHHGHFGCSSEFYKMVDAPTILYPTTLIKHDEEYDHFEANRVAHSLCKECYISSNGTVGFPLPYVIGNAVKYDDETFEYFDRIEELWGYQYTAEYKNKLREIFVENGGDIEDRYYD